MALLLLVSARLYAQGDTTSTTAALRTALNKLGKANESKTRFTYLNLTHTLNFNEGGKKTADITQLFDVTYIGDLQYSRLLEHDDKPLTGRALKEEQKRYDDAVRERSALDDNARAKIQHQLMKNAGVDLSHLNEYRNAVGDHATVDDRDCIVIDSTPVTETQKKHYRIWLDPKEEQIVRLEFNQLADEGDMLTGGSGMTEWIYVDGTPLVTRTHIDANVLDGKKRMRIVTDHTYSQFRKFSVTTTIIPVEPRGQQ
jgi:hypothetical protein